MNQELIYNFIETHCNEVENFISPLKKFRIYYLSFSRVYKNGKVIFFCSDTNWLETKFTHKLFDYNGFFPAEKEIIEHNHDKYVYAGDFDPNNRLQDFFYQSNKWNSLDIYDRKENYVDIIHFGSNRENIHAYDFYLNNLKILEDTLGRFVEVFKEKMDEFYRKYDLSLLSFCDSSKQSEQIVNENLFCDQESKNEYQCVDELWNKNTQLTRNIKKIPLFLNSETVYISFREAQCLLFLSRGRTVKEIGKELDLSPRTVESYIENIKNKTGIICRSTLVDIFYKNLPFINIYLTHV
ncbi:MAG: helix-turn-helix transcriptional regulator [Alphaproteobacteria bacterium]|nr:helix-turn-helix transcriptional regulator [Alphaproteobacteria bacterium]